METLKKTTSDQIKENMSQQGRSYTWLINQLNISRGTFYSRLNSNQWQINDIIIMQKIGVL